MPAGEKTVKEVSIRKEKGHTGSAGHMCPYHLLKESRLSLLSYTPSHCSDNISSPPPPFSHLYRYPHLGICFSLPAFSMTSSITCRMKSGKAGRSRVSSAGASEASVGERNTGRTWAPRWKHAVEILSALSYSGLLVSIPIKGLLDNTRDQLMPQEVQLAIRLTFPPVFAQAAFSGARVPSAHQTRSVWSLPRPGYPGRCWSFRD